MAAWRKPPTVPRGVPRPSSSMTIVVTGGAGGSAGAGGADGTMPRANAGAEASTSAVQKTALATITRPLDRPVILITCLRSRPFISIRAHSYADRSARRWDEGFIVPPYARSLFYHL